jgi:hypothetical protein
VTDRSVSNRKLAQIVTNHVSSDLNQVELFAVVDSDLRADHLRNDDHISKVGLDRLRLVKRTGSCRLLNVSEGGKKGKEFRCNRILAFSSLSFYSALTQSYPA